MAILSESGLQLEPYQIIVRPLITEKGTHLQDRYNVYAFEVHPQATKSDIKQAVQALWDVKVVDVRTQTKAGKPRRSRTGAGQTEPWKKALVQLHEDDRISLF